MSKIKFETNLKCDIGYKHLRKRLQKTHIEWTGAKETFFLPASDIDLTDIFAIKKRLKCLNRTYMNLLS